MSLGMSSKQVVVIGAGVIGLQTSILLLEAGFSVSIVAKHFPGDVSIEYTSPWGGAQWRSHSDKSDKRQCGWDIETYREWTKTIKQEEASNLPIEQRSGLSIVPSVLIWDSADHDELQPRGVDSLWFADKVLNFEEVDPRDESFPRGAAAAAKFQSVTVNVPKYLYYLWDTFKDLGGLSVRADLPVTGDLSKKLESAAAAAHGNSKEENSLQGHGTDTNVYVNCTGLGAKRFVGDETVFPIRGQTILVQGEANAVSTRQGTDPKTGEAYIAYVVPRIGSGTTLIGGSKDKGNWNTHIDEQLNERIIQRCRYLCPELLTNESFDIISTQIGFRPGRKDGARLEQELVKGKTLVHAYGNGGAGYQNSIGFAKEVVSIVQKSQ